VAYKRAQADQRGPVQVHTLDSWGRILSKRSIDTYATSAQGRIELRGLAEGSEAMLLAADIEKPDGSTAVYVEQFVPETGIGEITAPLTP
jgi:hypothetical protein